MFENTKSRLSIKCWFPHCYIFPKFLTYYTLLTDVLKDKICTLKNDNFD
jgi:hypothetical protein